MSFLIINNKGIYCPQGDFYIDPWRPVNRAIITHAHSDHARAGNKSYLCHPLTEPVLRQRLGKDINIQTQKYGIQTQVNGITISLHPAGHLPGSAQVRVEYKGEVWVVSGDYKLQGDPLSTPFEAIKCQHFITESTFGLPIYRWPDSQQVFGEMNDWWKNNQQKGQVSVVGTYSLGKAQRVLAGIDAEIGPIYTHGAVENVNDIYRSLNLALPETRPITDKTSKKDLARALVLAPPAALGSAWSRKLGPQSTAFCSGWMSVRGARRRRSADRGFVISDHADWTGLNQAVTGTEAEHIYVTHGYKNIYAKWLRENYGLNALSVDTLYEGESLDSSGD